MVRRNINAIVCLALSLGLLTFADAPRSARAGESATVRISATVMPVVLIDALSASPACELLQPETLGSVATFCVYTVPVTIRVRSNDVWTGTFSARDADTASSGPSVSSGDLRYGTVQPSHYADTASSHQLDGDPTTWASNHGNGVSTFTYYFLVRLSDGANLSDFLAVVSFAATQVSSGLTYELEVPVTFSPSA